MAELTWLNVNVEPEAVWISVLAVRLTNPVKLLEPERLDKVLPAEVMSSATVIPPEISKVVPVAKLVPAAVVPNAASLEIASTPWLIVTPPVNVFAPDRVSFPAPDFTKPVVGVIPFVPLEIMPPITKLES